MSRRKKSSKNNKKKKESLTGRAWKRAYTRFGLLIPANIIMSTIYVAWVSWISRMMNKKPKVTLGVFTPSDETSEFFIRTFLGRTVLFVTSFLVLSGFDILDATLHSMFADLFGVSWAEWSLTLNLLMSIPIFSRRDAEFSWLLALLRVALQYGMNITVDEKLGFRKDGKFRLPDKYSSLVKKTKQSRKRSRKLPRAHA